MNLSIRNMNQTVGQRDLASTGVTLTKLEKMRCSLEVAWSMQAQTGFENVQIAGANKEADILHELIEFLNTDPAHILNAQVAPFDDPRTPEQKELDQLGDEWEAHYRSLM